MRPAVIIVLTVLAVVVGAVVARNAPLPRSSDLTRIETYHGDPRRSGQFTVPGLTWRRAASLHLDPAFHAEFSGRVHAQPLYWTSATSRQALLIVATEENTVYALDARSGRTVWRRALGAPVTRSALACGGIFPLGITGTPVIDPKSETLYLDAAVLQPQGPRHLVFALDLHDGKMRPGWPVDIAAALAGQDPPFSPQTENQRGALAIFDGRLYVPFGGFFDCGNYHGTIIGISLKGPRQGPRQEPRKVTRWVTRASGGGIWAPGGIVADAQSLLFATGNTFASKDWADGEAVIRLAADLEPVAHTGDFFAPADWPNLDAKDSDLGGTAPILIEAPLRSGVQKLVLALGKDGKAYLLDHRDLGGIGGALAVMKVLARGIFAGAAAYRIGDAIYIAFPASGTQCANGGGKGLAVLAVRGGTPPRLSPAWCAQVAGLGAPIATTSDGICDPIVWMLGAEGDNLLHGFRGDTGEALFSGPQPLKGLHRFQTLIATHDRLYVAADGTIYAFAF